MSDAFSLDKKSFLFVSSGNVLKVTIDGELFVTYHETKPFAINYLGFAAPRDGDEALFYYNCQSKHSSFVNVSEFIYLTYI